MKKKAPKYKGVAEAMGIDLSDRTAQYCHLDADGEGEAAGRINLTPAGSQKAFGALAPMRMAIESGAQPG